MPLLNDAHHGSLANQWHTGSLCVRTSQLSFQSIIIKETFPAPSAAAPSPLPAPQLTTAHLSSLVADIASGDKDFWYHNGNFQWQWV